MHNAGTAVKRVAVTWRLPQEWTEVQQVLAALLQDCERSLAQHNPHWLGHCKALVEAGGSAAYGSITGADEPLSWRGVLHEPASEATLTLYCVVYAMADETVEAAVQKALAAHLPDAIEAPASQTPSNASMEVI
jgi:hypothetical protein